MGKLGDLFGKSKKKKEEEEDDDEEEVDISKLMQGFGDDESVDADSFGMDDGDAGSMGMGSGDSLGVSLELKEEVERNEEDIREMRVTVEKLENQFEDSTERLANIESNIDQLLDVYEMVSAEFNPFLEKTDNVESGVASRIERKTDMDGDMDIKGDLTISPGGMSQQPQQYSQPEQQGMQEQPQQYSQPEQQGMQEQQQQYSQPEQQGMQEQQVPPGQYTKGTQGSNISTGFDIEKISDTLSAGNTYLIEDRYMDLSYRIFKNVLGDYNNALCLTRKYPDTIKKQYGLNYIDFLWLSTSGEKNSVSPGHLDNLSFKLENFISKGDGVIFFEGIEYLLSNNNPTTVIRLIQSIQDQIMLNGVLLLIVVDPKGINTHHLELLKNELDPENINLESPKKDMHKSPDKMPLKTVDRMEKRLEKILDQSSEMADVSHVLNQMNEMIRYLELEEMNMKREIHDLTVDRSIKETSHDKDTSAELTELVGSLKEVINEYKQRFSIPKEDEKIDDEQARYITQEIVESFRKMSEMPYKTGAPPDFDEVFEDLKNKLILLYELKSVEESNSFEEKRTTSDIVEEKEVVRKSTSSYSGMNIGEDIKIEGDIQIYGDKIVVVGGSCVTGDIASASRTVVVEQNSRVEGKIKGKEVILGEEVTVGDIESLNDIEIGKRSIVNDLSSKGDIVLSLGVRIKGDMNYGGSLIFGEDELQLIESPKKEFPGVK